jgi:hypothetical protein
MKMRLNKTIYTTLFFLAAGTFIAKAQDVKPPEKAVTEEVEVIRPYKPVLAEAVKLRRSPDLDNIKTYKAKFNYTLTDRKLELNSDIQKLQAQQLADEHAAELVNNYVKGGIGSLATILGEAYVNIGRDEALQAGAFFRHFSQEGKLNKQNDNTQQLSVFGRSIGNKATLSGRLNYERHGLYFYGIDDLKPTLNPNPERQVLNFFELEGEAVNKYTGDENALSYAAKVNAYMFNDKFDAKEQALTLTGYLNKRISSFNVGLAAAAEIGNTKDFSTSVSNNLLRLNPYVKLQAKGVKITAGINFVQEFGDFSATRIFPAITADFTLIPDFLQIFGEVKGDVNRNTLKNFTDENPFLNSNIAIQNSVEKISISGGIKGTGGPGFGYKARFYSKKITDMPLFVNNFTDFNKFDVIYDFGTMKLLGLEGEISVQVSDDLKWTGKLNIEDYKAAAEQESYFKPQLRIGSNLLYTYNKKLNFNASVAIQGDSNAKIYTADPITAAGTYPPIPDFTKESIVNVKGFVDLGIGADYKINNKFSVFAKANNLLNTKYSKYLYYRVNGLNIFGGLTYSF